MVSICKFLNFISNIFIRPVFSGLFYLLFILILNDIMATEPKYQIEKIEILGLNRTKNYIIEREIFHPINSNLDSSLANLDRNRIFNLGLFDNVSWRIIPLENGNAILQYLMIESINRTPPLMFPAYDEEKGWSLNGVLIIKNFQGKNRTIEAIASIGGEKRLQFLINDPWIFGNHISLSAFIEQNSYDHLFLDRSVNIKNIKVSIGKWYGEKIKFRFSPTLTLKNFMNVDDTLKYEYLTPDINLEIDTRDIFWNPNSGIRIIQSVIPKLGENSFYVWNQSFSFYIPAFFKTVLAFNTTMQRKYGYKSDVWISYLGNSYNVRGWELPEKKSILDDYRFGHDYVFSSLELRKLVLNKINGRVGFDNGLCIVAFIDGGLISKEWEDLDRNKFIGGVGLGVRIPIPILQSLRIDVGWGIKDNKLINEHSFHFAVQQKF